MSISPVKVRKKKPVQTGGPRRSRNVLLCFSVSVGLVIGLNSLTPSVRSEQSTTIPNEPATTGEPSSNDHWAFRAPVRPKLPSLKHSGRARSAIDHFVRRRLEDEGLDLSPQADRYTLIRRVTLDLTGLPPAIEDVDAFINDPSPNAYAKVVDRLLASPQYGERWALWWLDLARYADSNGYESDRTRSIWPWRDWVIESLNNDMPFDQFTIEQIAGDMLPDATVSQHIATGFHRNTWINEEGGHDWEQFRYEAVVDRVHTTGTVFLGLTVACAQCHDHKYDPISQREYWQLFAFLNNADEPDFWVPDPGIRMKQEEIDAEVTRRVSQRAAHFPPFGPEIKWTEAHPTAADAGEGVTLTIQDDESIVVSGENPAKDTYVVSVETPLQKIAFFRLEVLPSGDKSETPIGRANDGNFVISDLRARVAPLRGNDNATDTENQWNAVTLTSATEERDSFAQQQHAIADAIDDDPNSGWAGDRGSTDLRTPRDVSFEIKKPIAFAGGTRVEFRIEQNMGRSLTMRRFRFSAGVAVPNEDRANLTEDESRRRHLDAKFRDWLADPPKRPISWNLLDPITAESSGNATMTELEDHSILVTGDRPEVDTYEIVYETDAKRVTGFRLEALPDSRLPNYGPGRGSFNGDGAFVISEFRVDLDRAPQLTKTAGGETKKNPNRGNENLPNPIKFASAYANYHSGKHVIGNAIDGKKLTSWFIGGGTGKRHVAVFETARPYEIAAKTRLRVTILQNYVHQQTLGRFRLFVTSDEGPLHSAPRPTSIDELLGKDVKSLSNVDRKILRNHYLSIAPGLDQYNAKLQALRETRPRFPTTFVFKERQVKHKRSTHVHERGEYQRPDEEVSAAVPAVLHSLSTDAPRDRLTFAKWLVHDRNPLVGRVIVNQLWQCFFGRGIVSTPENFGVEGAPPSHPQLLDWLAVEFQHGGWSLKSIQRQIVMSAVYRQSSKVSPELAKRDPQNILLARGPRFRVDAETIRDIALKASGLLNGTIGGPSVFPPQPSEAGSTFGPFRWKDSTGADRYRRGLYTFRKRGGPYAAFATFDAPPPNTCAMSRRRSNTPLQALAQLNDLVIIEASRALAGRVICEASTDTTARVRHAFRLTLTRPPSQAELTALIAFHNRQLRRFEEGSLDPEDVYGAKVGNDETKLRSLAAMTTLARLLLNLDETITKE